jgi:hypothetical protein
MKRFLATAVLLLGLASLFVALALDFGPGTAPYTVVAQSEADVKIVDQYFLNPPEEIDVSEDVNITLRKTLHNNGPDGPVDVNVTTDVTVPVDCTATPDPHNPTSANLPVSTDVVVDEVWTIHCEYPSSHTSEFVNTIAIATGGVSDPNSTNNVASTLLTLDAIGYADVKVVGQHFYGPEEMDVSVTESAYVETMLHNNGPDGPVEVTVGYTATAPADCEIYWMGEPEQWVLPVSVDVMVPGDFEIHCYEPSSHTFWVESWMSGPKEPHFSDPAPGNNSWSSDLTVDAIGSPTPVGGIAELPDVSGSSDPNYALVAGVIAAAVVALTAGAWYARRRWSR